MPKKSCSINFNKDYIILTIIVVIILLGVYLLHLHIILPEIGSLRKTSRKNSIENFYQQLNNPKLIIFDPNTLYIYAAKREVVSCSEISKFVKNGGIIPDNIPIAGIPNFDLNNYDSSKAFCEPNGLPTPTSMHGKLLDYVIATLTMKDNIKYYTTDNAGNFTDPLLNKQYYYNKNVRENISDPIFLDIITELFKTLIACNNNTTIRFIRYYKKDTVSINSNGTKNFEEIEEKDLEKEIKNNNVIIFYENINIISFLQVSNPQLYNKYLNYNNNLFKIKFIDPTNNQS
jgi:hypothetical protein